MPRLPSGRHVGLADQPIKELAKQGDFNLKLFFPSGVRKPADMAPLICIVYFHPGETDTVPGESYLSGLMLSDIGTNKCDWSQEDISAFNTWLETPRSQAFLKQGYDELHQILATVKAKLPESLQGVLHPNEVDVLAQVLKHKDDD